MVNHCTVTTQIKIRKIRKKNCKNLRIRVASGYYRKKIPKIQLYSTSEDEKKGETVDNSITSRFKLV